MCMRECLADPMSLKGSDPSTFTMAGTKRARTTSQVMEPVATDLKQIQEWLTVLNVSWGETHWHTMLMTLDSTVLNRVEACVKGGTLDSKGVKVMEEFPSFKFVQESGVHDTHNHIFSPPRTTRFNHQNDPF